MSTTPELDPFETKLLGELRTVVDERAAKQSTTAPIWRRSAVAVAASVGLVGVISAGLMGQTSPAYALENDGGEITVKINRLESAEQLEADLAALGINAVVDYTPTGTLCAPGRFTPADTAGNGVVTSTSDVADGDSLSFSADMIGPGQTLVIETMWPSEDEWAMGLGIAEGEVGECTPVPMEDVFEIPEVVGPDGVATEVVITDPEDHPAPAPTR